MGLKSRFFAVVLLNVALFGAIFTACSDSDEFSCNNISVTTTPYVQSTEVTAVQAQDIARAFSSDRFGITPTVASRSSQSIETITGEDGSALAYVINTDGAGWVIVSALRTYYPILAYSDKPGDTFILSDKVVKESGLSMWMADIRTAIETSETLDSLTARSIAYEWFQCYPETVGINPGLPGGNDAAAKACRDRLKVLNETYYKDGWTFRVLTTVSEVTIPSNVYATADYCGSPYQYTIIGLHDISTRGEVSPLLTTSWHQHSPYNTLCNGAAAGCVPIAMAQIMKFHKYPNNYNWANIPDIGATSDTQKLIFDIGTNVGIKYEAGKESGADGNDAVNGFKKMGYTATKKSFMTTDVVREIATYNRPVYLRGIDTDTHKGHAWVCDGFVKKISEYEYYVEYLNSVNEYTNYGETLMENPGTLSGQSYTTLHMNWGWGGEHNGNFITPTPGEYNFSSNREYILVSPNK